MFLFNICPPDGPWVMPPWCESNVINSSVNNVVNNSVTVPNEEVKFIDKYLPSSTPILGRITYYDISDLALSPTMVAWGLTVPVNNLDTSWMKREQEKGASHIAVVSLWNNDEWVNVNDLPDELRDCYVTDINGNPLLIQGKLFLNLLCPGLRSYVKRQVKELVLAGTDGIAFDEINGNAMAVVNGEGPFDNYSIIGFRDYLKNKYSVDELASMGINDIDSFNYTEFIKSNGYSFSDFWNNPAPLQRDYYYYLLGVADEFINDLITYAKSFNPNLLIGVNNNPFYHYNVQSFLDKVDLFVFEHEWFPAWRHNFPAGFPSVPAVSLVVNNGRIAGVMPMLKDMVSFSESAREELFKHEFAEVYAARGYYMYFPDVIYDGVNYTTNRDSIKPYFSFVRNNPKLFNLTSYAHIGVIAPSINIFGNDFDIDAPNAYATALLINNYPFDVINVSRINDYDLVIASGITWSDSDFNKLMSYLRDGGLVIASDPRFASFNELNQSVNRLNGLRVTGLHNVGSGKLFFFNNYLWWNIWSKMSDDSFKPLLSVVNDYVNNSLVNISGVILLPYINNDGLIIHLLNYDFNNGFINKSDFSISVELPNGLSVNNVTLVSPDFNEVFNLSYNISNGFININVPKLNIWDVITIN